MEVTQYGPQNKQANLSPLMKALSRASVGEKVNACPFGCQADDLDENGYCDHLVGFTNDGISYEPMVATNKPGTAGRVVRGGEKQAVRKGDRLVQITTSSRVYRDIKERASKVE